MFIGLGNDIFHDSDHMEWKFWMLSELWIGKNLHPCRWRQDYHPKRINSTPRHKRRSMTFMVTAVGTISTVNSVLFFVASCFYRHIAPLPSILLTVAFVFRFNVHNQCSVLFIDWERSAEVTRTLVCASNDRRTVILSNSCSNKHFVHLYGHRI